jgi:hypothetical protein
MAAVPRPVILQDRDHAMKKTNNPLTSATKQPGRRPVRVRLRRINANLAKAYPPDGENRVWWTRLKQALGTRSSDFVDASLYQLQAAAQMPCGGISEMALNAALAMIETAAPRDEMEAALAIQMACTHAATMSVLARFGGGHGSERRVAALGSAAARLLRAYSAQVEVFRRLRHGGQQLVRVEHVHINGGGQAIIGNVNSSAAFPKSTPEEVVETRPTPDLMAKSSEDSSSSGCRFIGDGPEGGEASDHR